jgi:hypothetical protein
MVRQPVIFQGALPADERSAVALFALAAHCPQPIPVVAEIEVLPLSHGLRPDTTERTEKRHVGLSSAWLPENCQFHL